MAPLMRQPFPHLIPTPWQSDTQSNPKRNLTFLYTRRASTKVQNVDDIFFFTADLFFHLEAIHK